MRNITTLIVLVLVLVWPSAMMRLTGTTLAETPREMTRVDVTCIPPGIMAIKRGVYYNFPDPAWCEFTPTTIIGGVP